MTPLWQIAARLAEWKSREGFADHIAHPYVERFWLTDRNWTASGRLPSGDAFTLYLRCEGV